MPTKDYYSKHADKLQQKNRDYYYRNKEAISKQRKGKRDEQKINSDTKGDKKVGS